MGYEITLIIGKTCLEGDELERDLEHPFADESGHPYKKDANGDYVKTGRRESYFMQMAEVDLCKVGYQSDAFNRLVDKTHEAAKSGKAKCVYFIYGADGNTRLEEDRYEMPLWPVAIADVLLALVPSHPKGSYRRTDWAIALLSAMADDPEGLEVIFYGH